MALDLDPTTRALLPTLATPIPAEEVEVGDWLEHNCRPCRGSGHVTERAPSPTGGVMSGEYTCVMCDGSGKSFAPVMAVHPDSRFAGRWGFQLEPGSVITWSSTVVEGVARAVVEGQVRAGRNAAERRRARWHRATEDATYGEPPRGWEP